MTLFIRGSAKQYQFAASKVILVLSYSLCNRLPTNSTHLLTLPWQQNLAVSHHSSKDKEGW